MLDPSLRAIATASIAAVALAGCVPSGGAPREASLGRAAAVADSLLRDLAERGLFQGAAVLARGSDVALAVGYGEANRTSRTRFTPDTPTDAASLAKTFTAAGLILLADEGLVDLDAPVRAYVPAYPHPDTRVRHLLAHAAGLPDYAWFDTLVAPGTIRTNDLHLEILGRAEQPPAFFPGTQFAYDNVAYDVAAMVIERAAGTTYEAFVRDRFAGPLGFEAFVRPARFADWPGVRTRGYRRVPDGWEDYDAYDDEGFYGADNLYLSARALQRWVGGYGEILGGETLRDAVTPARLDDGRATGISQGSWYVSPDGGRRHYSGHHNGFYSLAYADDVRGISLAWVANDKPPSWLQPALTRALVAVLEGREPERIAPPPESRPVGDPTGEYTLPGLGTLEVRAHGDGLRIALGRVEYDAFEVERGVHYLPGLDAYVRFRAAPQSGVVLSWDSVFLVAETPRSPPAG